MEKRRVVFPTEHQFDVVLVQTSECLFRVEYGADIRDNLTYEEAAMNLGSCLMHARCCNGEIENECSLQA